VQMKMMEMMEVDETIMVEIMGEILVEMQEIHKPRPINTCKQMMQLSDSSILNILCYNLSISHHLKDPFLAKSNTQRIPGYRI
jgi:hypothetical protein